MCDGPPLPTAVSRDSQGSRSVHGHGGVRMPPNSHLLSSCWHVIRAAAQQLASSAAAMPCNIRTQLTGIYSSGTTTPYYLHTSWHTCSMLPSASQPLRSMHASASAAVQQHEEQDNSRTQPVAGSQHRRRFFKSVNVVQAQDGSGLYNVLLDTRPVRTPGKHLLALPSYSLALAIAAEWAGQTTGKPQMHTMPLMSIAATAVDQPKPRDKVIETLLKYVQTDATCCRVEDYKVAARQAEVHDPLLAWAARSLTWKLEASDQLFAPPQPPETVAAVRQMLEGLNAYELAAMEQLTAVCKSVVIAAALLRGQINIQEALVAARVEEDCQTAEWGTVEAGHDLDVADIATRIAAPSLFLRLMAHSHGVCASNVGKGGTG